MSNNKIHSRFMAFAKGKESSEGMNFKKYIGVAPVKVLAINPTKAKLEEIYGTTLESDPVYIGKAKNKDGSETPFARIDFIVCTDPEKIGIDMKTKLSFFIRKEPRMNNDKTKIQVINKYGETTWVPVMIDGAKNGSFSGGPEWFEHADTRPIFVGEEDLTTFLKAYLNIPSKSYKKADGTTVTIENKADAEARLDNIKSYFDGHFSEIANVYKLQPDNKVKVLFGVRKTDDGKEYQSFYTNKFLKNNITDYSRLDKELQERKQAGAYPSTEFEVCDLKEYDIEPTIVPKSSSDIDDMFGAASTPIVPNAANVASDTTPTAAIPEPDNEWF